MVFASSGTSDEVDPAVYRVGGLVWNAVAAVGILGDGGLVLLGGPSCFTDRLGPWLRGTWPKGCKGLEQAKYRGRVVCSNWLFESSLACQQLRPVDERPLKVPNSCFQDAFNIKIHLDLK